MTNNAETNVPPTANQPDTAIFLWGASLLAAAVFVAVLFLAGFRLPGAHDDELLKSPRRLADFAFTERSGRTVTRDDLRGKYLVVNFVHTGCSISCATVNRQMAKVQEIVSGQEDVQLVSFTVDPGTDSPAALSKFAEQFGADKRRWIFLTGAKPILYQFIETSFLSRDTNATYMAMPGGFRQADHIAVVDQNGMLRKLLPGTKSDTPQNIKKAIDELRGVSHGRLQ